ncbi:MAG: hypothetical protein SFZ23_08900 [Planctomycetota bacterium]|nr:hypothetical protein [Planctomycetota bacterium]
MLLVALSVLPAGWLRWASWFGELATTLVAPVSHVSGAVGRWLRPAERRAVDPDAALREQAEHFELLYRQQVEETRRLRELLSELQLQRDLSPGDAVRLLAAPVVATSSDLTSGILRVRAGSGDGVERNAVATVRGLQLLGRVVGVSSATCSVQPIVAKAAGAIQGRIILSEVAEDGSKPLGGGEEALLCVLDPVGDGTLRGLVEYRRAPSGDGPLLPKPGQVVRLDDARWVREAQALRIGIVRSVAPSATDAQRTIVVVQPEIPRLDRVGEVVLRLTRREAETGEAPRR